MKPAAKTSFLSGRNLALITVVLAALAMLMIRLNRPTVSGGRHALLNGLDVLADESRTLLQKRGNVVVIASEFTESPAQKIMAEQFTARLTAKSDIHVIATEQLSYASETLDKTRGGVTATAFLDLLKKHPKADAFVSLVGPVQLGGENRQLLPSPWPKVILFECGATKSLRRMFKVGIVDLAIVHRTSGMPGTTSTGNKEFDARYAVVKPATADQLPE